MNAKYAKLYLFAAVIAAIALAINLYAILVQGRSAGLDLVTDLALTAFMLFMWTQARKEGRGNG